MDQLLFVYGTLKRGLCRHSFLESSCFLGLGKSQAAYRMFDLGDYPGLIEQQDGVSVPGEVFQVNESTLVRLDVVEGVAQGLYRRGMLNLKDPWIGQKVVTYFYSMSVEGRPEVSQWPPQNKR